MSRRAARRRTIMVSPDDILEAVDALPLEESWDLIRSYLDEGGDIDDLSVAWFVPSEVPVTGYHIDNQPVVYPDTESYPGTDSD